MSLKTFHIVFIAVSTALSLFMALWGFNDSRFSGSGSSLFVGIVGLVGLAALLPYYRWFRNKFRKMALTLALSLVSAWFLQASSAPACAVCFGDPNSDMIKGVKAGVLLLILVIGGVLGGIVAVAFTWARRAKALEG